MKYLMVKRCDAEYVVDEGIYRITRGLDYLDLTAQAAAEPHLTVRCEEPLGHKERGHHGSQYDDDRHTHSWAGWGQP